ncbi:MAG: ion transporter [Woeseiaceae bacterium]|nr:ion transporter [Woeseiaceae bacterium]
MNSFVDFFLAIRNSRAFNTIVIAVILASAFYAGVTTYDLPDDYEATLNFVDYAITIFFSIEILIRLMSEKPFYNFFKSGWNVFDFIIVAVSLIPVGGAETVFVARLLRIVRILRVITIVPEFRRIIDGLVKTIPRVGFVVLLMFIFFYIWATIGSMLFNDIDPNRWGNVGSAMLVLLQLITYDDWAAVMGDVLEVYPYMWVYFVSFLILNGFILFNMVIGIIVDVMSRDAQVKHAEQIQGSDSDTPL